MVSGLTNYCLTLNGYLVGAGMYLLMCGILILAKRVTTKREILHNYKTNQPTLPVKQPTIGALILIILVGFIPLMGYGLLIYTIAYCIVRVVVNGGEWLSIATITFVKQMRRPLIDPEKVISAHLEEYPVSEPWFPDKPVAVADKAPEA